ncbi:MAG: hypothetical protein ACLS2V_11575 [Clostridium paraputrificum]
MINIFFITLILGLLIIFSNYIDFTKLKPQVKAKRKYSKSNFKNLLEKLSKILKFNFLSKIDSPFNLRKKEKLKVIYQTKISDEIYGLKHLKYKDGKFNEVATNVNLKSSEDLLEIFYIKSIVILILAALISTGIKVHFNTLLEKESISSITIYEELQYKLPITTVNSISEYIGESYKNFLSEKNYTGFYEYVNKFVNEARLNVEKDDLNSILNIYRDAYLKGKMSILDIAFIVIMCALALISYNLYINLKYRLCNIKLLSEFHRIELLTLFHMGRKDLNVYEMLRKVNKHTVYLRPYIDRCLNRYTNDPVRALDLLIKEVDNKNMESFITILKSCLSISKNVNLDILQTQRELRIKTDRIDSNKVYEFKLLCLDIASLPLIALFTFNLLIPFLGKLNFNSISMF